MKDDKPLEVQSAGTSRQPEEEESNLPTEEQLEGTLKLLREQEEYVRKLESSGALEKELILPRCLERALRKTLTEMLQEAADQMEQPQE